MLGATLPVLMAPMMLLMEGAPPDGCWVVSVSASSIPAFAHASSSTPGFILRWGAPQTPHMPAQWACRTR